MRSHQTLASSTPPPLILTLDRKQKAGPRGPAKTGRAERIYAKQLRAVGGHVGEIISGFTPGDLSAVPSLMQLLDRYAEALTPWATRTASTMLLEVNAADRESWRSLGNAISAGLRKTLAEAPVSGAMNELLHEQIALIKSIPREAGERVHELTQQALIDSTRAKSIAEEIARSGDVAESRAMLIARTEVSRTASTLVKTRAQYAGSTRYIWRTSRDGSVRPGHQDMEGEPCEWASPPAVNENGRIMHFHPGCIWNCRCFPEPILSDQ